MARSGGPVAPSTKGMLAFLLTDIEGSTRLWQLNRTGMRRAIARHDELVTACVKQHRGRVLKERGEGDSVFAVFARATDAVSAAADIQRAVATEAWADHTQIRVRIAVNVGEADSQYRGTAVNRCARIRALAAGGEVLLSHSTAMVVRDELPAGLQLIDLGQQQLRDLTSPEQVFRLVIADLPSDSIVPPAPIRQQQAAVDSVLLERQGAQAAVERLAAHAPQTHYAIAEKNVHVAYQVVGGGAHDLVFVPPFLSNVEVWWELPVAARFFNRLAGFARLILLDKRGTGLSDRLSTVETPEERIDDIRAVMDAVGSKKAAIFAASESVAIAILFAATYPDRTARVVSWGGLARFSPAPDYPWSVSDDLYTKVVELAASQWGTGFTVQLMCPSRAAEPRFRDWFAHYERVSASPGGLATFLLNNTALDVRAILPSIQVPTLLLHAEGDTFADVGNSRYMASRIPGAKYVELPGTDHLWFSENGDRLADEIEEFLTGTRHVVAPNRVLATVLFVEIVAGADLESRRSEESWRDGIDQFIQVSRKEIASHRGLEVDASSDRLLATFDGPARAIYGAQSITRAAERLGIQVRLGLHAGECEHFAGKIGGIALQVLAAVKDQAAPGEIAVSSTVRDLVAGAGIAFEERGKFRLPNVSAEWGVLVVVDPERAERLRPQPDPAREAFESAVERAVGGPRTRPLTPLSKRESEVALLLADGLTNRQVAARLFLSERTVEWHIEQMLGKLGLTNRVQVASWVAQRSSRSPA